MSEPEGGEEEDRDGSTSERTESERGSPPQHRYSRRHRRRGGGSPEERERERRFTDEMERKDEDAMRERRRLFRYALSSLLGSIKAATAARACHAPILTFGFYDYFLRFISSVFDSKGADAILSFEKFCCNLLRSLLQVPSTLAGLESLPEAYQQRMASMMEQVQIRDRKMQIYGATDLASKGQGASDSSNVKIKEKPMEGVLPVPDKFYCELCRLSRADPFWVSMGHPLFPVKLSITSHNSCWPLSLREASHTTHFFQ
ncbi:hypothetical protein HN51_008052 [Arachis hypogaea]